MSKGLILIEPMVVVANRKEVVKTNAMESSHQLRPVAASPAPVWSGGERAVRFHRQDAWKHQIRKLVDVTRIV